MKSFATMMKYALAAALFFTSADAALAQTPKKRVLLEDGTGAWCGYCPRGATTLEKIVEKYPDQVIGVAMHNNDKMSVPEEPNFSAAYINGYPNGVVDRAFFTGKSGAKSGASDAAWESMVVTQLAKTTNADVGLSNIKYNTSSRLLTFDVTSTFTSAMSGDYRFNAYVVEDSVVGSGTGYDQVNYMDGDPSSPWFGKGNPIEGFVHRHVVRHVAGGMFGDSASLPASIAANTPYKKSYSLTVPEGWDDTKLSIVGFVMKSGIAPTTLIKQHAVLNAIDAKVPAPAKTTNVSIVTPFDVRAMNSTSDVSTTIKNITSAPITYTWTVKKSDRTPADWTAEFSEAGEFTLSAGESKDFSLKLTPGSTIGIGDAILEITEKNNPDSRIYNAKITVLSSEVERLSVYSDDEIDNSISDELIASGRNNYFEITSSQFLSASSSLNNLKTVVWTGGQRGALDMETSIALLSMMSNGVGVMTTGSIALLGIQGNPLMAEMGISRVIDVQLEKFSVIGYANDPISKNFDAAVSLLGGGYYGQEYRVEDETIANPLLRLKTANRIVATRSQTSTARAINIAFNPLAITDVAKRNDFMDKAMDWLETAAAPTAKLEISTTLVDFEEVKANETKEMTVDITSNGGIPLVISGLTISGDQASNFTLVNAPGFPLTLNTGETTTITVKFMPNAEGDFLASLDITSNAEGTNSVILSGVGIKGGTSVDEFTSGSLEFLTVKVGPNPVTVKSVVSYSVRGLAPQAVELSIIDALGNTVHNFGVQTLAPGAYTQEINASAFASGSYRLVARSNETAVQVPFVIAR